MTSCISTILFILTKNQNVSILSSVPIYYVLALLRYGTTHLLFLLVVMLVQATIVLNMQHQSKQESELDIKEKQQII
ncbi:hypothetical protein JFL43_10550 [Viridibacillus sp. YIM B01967]|uniref:Uncharacterized protein n=1 Tax=Viridibacillus soli TaxID=2798301 RepID=A0ABS1H795_9BACL|nr:hypothetical protein [Viridibacillus soli]MBK3495283.1 hypothetical protein [Viridibacillus soli]